MGVGRHPYTLSSYRSARCRRSTLRPERPQDLDAACGAVSRQYRRLRKLGEGGRSGRR